MDLSYLNLFISHTYNQFYKTGSFHNSVNLSVHWLVSCNTSIIQELYHALQIWYFYMYNLIIKTIIALTLFGYEMIIVSSMLHASLANHWLISNLHSWNNR